jgi:transcriptional regulator with GAF, ATPase, and Fis domain
MSTEFKSAIHRIGPVEIIGQSPQTRDMLSFIHKAAANHSSVLLEGESGAGKEVMAQAIHFASARAAGPFVAVNCGAIHHELIESELFGHEKGAFTGAVARKLGRFERANGGTLFLDEIGELPLQNASVERKKFRSTSASCPRPTAICGTK